MKNELKLDYTYALILEKLYKMKRMAQIARELHMSKEAVRKRLKKLIEYGRIMAKINYRRIGLSRIFLMIKGYRIDDKNALMYRYIRAIVKLLTPRGEIALTYITPPKGYENKLIEYCKEVIGGKIISSFKIYDVLTWRPVSKLYDFGSEDFPIRWNNILNNVLDGYINLEVLPKYGDDDDDFVGKIDRIDLNIIRALEKNALINMGYISRRLNKNSQLINYHYNRHVKPLIESYCMNITFGRYSKIPASYHILSFNSREKMLSFISSIMVFPAFKYIYIYEEKPEIMLLATLDHTDHFNFMRIISVLKDENIIRNYYLLGYMEEILFCDVLPQGAKYIESRRLIIPEEKLIVQKIKK